MSEESSRKRFTLFKKKASANEESSESFDESCFEFMLKSNNYHTCLVEASAVMKKGKYIGMPLPLKCTWYRATDEKEFVTIEGITGAFYQPNADDIGCKICVHAVPVSEVQEYIGMPAFSEVGPIQIDPEIQSNISEILNKNQVNFNVKLGNKPGNLIIDKDILKVYSEESVLFSCNLIESTPKIEINHKANPNFALIDREQKVEIQIDKPGERDFIVICIRSFCSKAQSLDIAEIMVKNQQLSSRLFEANRNYEISLTTINNLKEDLQYKITDLYNLSQNFSTTSKELLEAKEALAKALAQLEVASSEVVFLRKDILVYKEQCSLLDSKIEQQSAEEGRLKGLINDCKDELETLAKIMVCGTCRIDERLYIVIDRLSGNNNKKHRSRTSSAYSLQEDTIDSEKEKNKEPEQFTEQIKLLKDEFSDLLNKTEAEKNFYKRKVDSLVAENDKLLSKLGKNPKEINEFLSEKQNFEKDKLKIKQETENMKKKIAELEGLLKVNKRKFDEEIDKNFELRKLSENKGTSNSVDYQKIVNSLTQTLTDRETELSSQKKINKELMIRISELEASFSRPTFN